MASGLGQTRADRRRRARASVDAALPDRRVDRAARALLARQLYVADRGLATSIYLALKLQRPLFLEGEAGVGKTEVAKVLAAALGTELIRLQCYEGLDVSQARVRVELPAPAPRDPAAGGRRRRRSRRRAPRSCSAKRS